MRRLHLFLCAALLLSSACARTTIVESETPLDVRARPPAPPPAELAAVDQPPPPPPRVVREGELVRLDEALAFDAADQLAPDSVDIVDALASWLLAQPSGVLAIEVHVVGKGSRKQLTTRSKTLAQRVVDALVARGVAPERVRASGLGKSPDEQQHVVLRMLEATP